MDPGLDKALADLPEHALARLAFSIPSPPRGTVRGEAPSRAACYHCGEPCPDARVARAGKLFCCQGCLVVHDLLVESGLQQFYDLSAHPGVRIKDRPSSKEWAYLDEPAVQQQLLDFTDGKIGRVTFHIPAIHCVACVWLLENLFRLHTGIGQTQVNFAKREAALSFAPDRITLSEVAVLLASIGYAPQLTLGELEKRQMDPGLKKRWLQVGIAGFAFGNIMLFSLPAYLGLDSLSGPLFGALFGYLSLALAIPVLVYSAADYWRAALLAIRQQILTLDVPIALGLAALYAQSASEILSGRGEGYLDSMAGLVFLLLCGRAFQQKTQERLVFDRDYKSFFPLAATRKTSGGEEAIALSQLGVGDRLLLRNGELIPADARLISGSALIDYSFVTGESEPVPRQGGDYLYAGGQQTGAAVEIETIKPVSQSYLASLWSHQAFKKEPAHNLDTLTNRYSRRFTLIVILAAAGAALFWALSGDVARGVKAFTSVLIVACPCALALAAPFALGTAQRILAGIQIFFKNTFVLERMARIDTIVFDKTGTLSTGNGCGLAFCGHQSGSSSASPTQATGVQPEDNALSLAEAGWVCALADQSVHPHAVKIRESLCRSRPEEAQIQSVSKTEHSLLTSAATTRPSPSREPLEAFAEKPGFGISGRVQGHALRLGSRAWLEEAGILLPALERVTGSASYLSIDGTFRGVFCFSNQPRPDTDRLLKELGRDYELILLSGDNERECERYRQLFGPDALLHFNQTPYDKLEFVGRLQERGKTVLMVGDGLNDAGALKQSDVGVAVVERIGVFSPASDVILEASQVRRLCEILRLARKSVAVVRWSFGISAAYNLAGVSIAAAGILSPLICAVLMPLSSLSVVLFACGMAQWVARKLRLNHS